jgi:hypothetical protein
MSKIIECPETGRQLGAKANVSIYKHCVQTFHLEPRGTTKMLKDLEGKTDLRSERIRFLLEASVAQEEGF